METYAAKELHSLKGLQHIIDIRNLGLTGEVELEPMAGEPTKRAFAVIVECSEKGLLIRTAGDIIAVSPVMILENAYIDTRGDVLKGLG